MMKPKNLKNKLLLVNNFLKNILKLLIKKMKQK